VRKLFAFGRLPAENDPETAFGEGLSDEDPGRIMKSHKEGKMETRIAVFKGKEVRRILFQNEWYFSVVDICSDGQ